MSASVKPRDAASLLLLRQEKDETRVLMGRRPTHSAFAPDVFVFPGGKVDRQDGQTACPFPLETDTLRSLRTGSSVSLRAARALANAAIRETYEETGLLLARPADFRAPGPGTWHAFEQHGLGPDHGALRMIGRAITPSTSPVRYHARFFVAQAAGTRGELRASEELVELDWYPIGSALKLPIIDVTHFMLEETLRWRQTREGREFRQPRRRLFVRYRAESPVLAYEALRDPG